MAAPHIHISILNQGWVRVELANVIDNAIVSYRKGPLSIEYSGLGAERRPICSNRNRIVRDCPPEAEILCMIDSDCIPPFDFLDAANPDLDIIGLPMPIYRGGEIIMGIRPLDDRKTVTVGEMAYEEERDIAGGLMFIARQVFAHPAMRGAFRDKFDKDGVLVSTEDHVYCDRARKQGFKVWAALGYPLGHVKEVDLKKVWEMRHAVVSE